MANDSDSLPPSWIRTTKVKKSRSRETEKTCYINKKTDHCFDTRQDLDRYVEYVKRDLPLLYAFWEESENECTGREGGYYDVKRKKGQGKKASNKLSKEEEIGEISCTPRGSHISPEPQPVIFDGPFRRPKDKEKVVCTTSSSSTTGLSESYSPIVANTLPRKKDLSVSMTRGKKSGADGPSSFRRVLLPGASILRPTTQTRDREAGWL